MLQIFNKKKFLIDYLENFVDIHNHILPGIDDGAKTADEAVALIKGFSEFGVTTFVATPHIMSNYYPNTPKTINDSLTVLKNELFKNNLNHISLSAAAEHMIDANYEILLAKNEVMPLRKDYLLIEMSYLQPPINFDEAIVQTAKKRFFPILAHPERYAFLHRRYKKYKQYKDQGIQFQLNILSLSNFYGKETTKTAFKLLEDGLIDFMASDVHNINQLNELRKITLSQKKIDLILPIIRNTIQTFY